MLSSVSVGCHLKILSRNKRCSACNKVMPMMKKGACLAYSSLDPSSWHSEVTENRIHSKDHGKQGNHSFGCVDVCRGLASLVCLSCFPKSFSGHGFNIVEEGMSVREDELVCLAGDCWLKLEIHDTGIVTWMFPATTLQSQAGSVYLRIPRNLATIMFDSHQH